jgi:hypothetical protein
MVITIKFLLIATFAFSILFKFWNYICFYSLYRAGRNMSATKSEMANQIKKRYSDCVSLGKPIENTESFIRKYLLSSGRYNSSFSLKENFSTGFLLIFFGLLWSGYINGMFSYENTIICTAASTVLFYIGDRIFDTCAIESGFITYAADYLDNTLKSRFVRSGAALAKCISTGQAPRTTKLTEQDLQKYVLLQDILNEQLSEKNTRSNSTNTTSVKSDVSQTASNSTSAAQHTYDSSFSSQRNSDAPVTPQNTSDTDLFTSIINDYIL